MGPMFLEYGNGLCMLCWPLYEQRSVWRCPQDARLYDVTFLRHLGFGYILAKVHGDMIFRLKIDRGL